MIRATVNGPALAAAMKHGIAARSAVLPALQHALVEAVDGGLRISSTDLETHVTVAVPAEIEEAGSACALDAMLRAGAAAGESIRIVDEGNSLSLRGAGRTRLRVPALPAHEYPALDDEAWQPLSIDPIALRSALEQVAYAADPNDIRQYCQVVCVRDGEIVATDGARCGYVTSDYRGATLMIPVRRVPALVRLLTEDAVLSVCPANNSRDARMLRIAAGNVVMTVLLSKPQPAMPDFTSLMPDKRTTAFEFIAERAALLASARGLLPFATARNTYAGALLCGDAEGVLLQAGDDALPVAGAAIETGAEARIGFKLPYLIQCLESIPDARIRVSIVGDASHGSAYLLPVEGDAYFHILASCAL